ncbi:MAG TPA: diphosphomevalonate decarboxylase [Tissierellaceae bacterium]|nr:diphosphomevalonate decarboxylase [Tissierellaceae bacterium]
MENRGKAKAHANIALIKYWGKRDEEVSLPMNSSLSLTLDCFYTETEVVFDKDIDKDYFYLDGSIQDEIETKKITNFLDLFRSEMNIEKGSIVKSVNHVPTAAGLASSSSGFAALAAATNVASGLNLDSKELSMYARRGSGSAARSIYGGFVEWQKGNSKDDSFVVPIDDADWDVGMIIVIVNEQKKKLSSRKGMKRTVETSPFYKGWVESTEKDIKEIKVAIKNKNFEQMGSITERNGLKMHGTMLGANPPISYWEPDSIVVMDIVRSLRDEGIPCYFTMDAGPNVKILCKLSQTDIIKKRLEERFNDEQIIVTGPGPGIVVD